MYCESRYTTTSQEFSPLDFDMKEMLGQCNVNEQNIIVNIKDNKVCMI